MAAPDAKYKKTEENKQKNAENPEAGDQAEIKGKKGMKKMLIAIAGLVVLIAGGLVFGLPYLKQATASAEQGTENKESGKSESSATSHEPVKATLALDPFLVNLADKEDVRFVKTTFKLGLAEEPDEKAMEVTIPAMRDSIITLLTSKTAEQILTAQGKVKLREQIKTRMNELSPELKVVEVYIVDFVVQL